MTKEILLKINNLSVNIDNKLILDGISFELDAEKIITIIGPNGSGKTTLLRAILGLENSSQGTITFSPKIKIGYMPQKIILNLYMPLKVIDFLRLQVSIKLEQNYLNQIIGDTKIKDVLESPLQKISGGEMQRVLLARALLNKPKILILDEPVSGLDIKGQEEFYNLIDLIRKERKISVLMVSHDLHMVMKNTDYVICLNKHICCEGTVESINKSGELENLFASNSLKSLSIYKHHHNHVH